MILPLAEVSIRSKGRKIIRSNKLKSDFQYIKKMVSYKTLLNYPDWKILFTVHTYYYNRKFGAFLIQNNKSIDLF